ncbi:MAG: hypothetical protein LBU20_02645 [Candidatus Nomurabacteria bacterium]|nr:hypothetical protein [Candidatus Nomurabacteria bacterium]
MALGLVSSAIESALAVVNPAIELSNDPVGLAVSPFFSERLSLDPGSVIDGEFKVYSIATETMNVFTELAPYSLNKTTRQRDFNTETPRTHIAKWATLELKNCDVTKREDARIYFTMRPREECIISYHIAVPADALGGSQDAGIFVQNITPDGDEGISSAYRIGHMIYSDVSGPEAHYAGEITRNYTPSLLIDKPIVAQAAVENTGNLDFYADYEVKIANWFGGEEVFSKSWQSQILADGGLDENTTWNETPALGLYKVSQKINILDQESRIEKLVLVVPLWLLIIFACVILLLMWAVVLKIKQRREFKKMIAKEGEKNVKNHKD